MDTLLDIIRELEPLERRALGSIRVEWDGTTATATLSIALYGPVGFGRGQYASVDRDGLPAGVGLAGAERHPDIVRPIRLPPPLDEQIIALGDSGVVGTIDACRFDRDGDGLPHAGIPVVWLAKTHAGSDAERAAWLHSLPRGGVHPEGR